MVHKTGTQPRKTNGTTKALGKLTTGFQCQNDVQMRGYDTVTVPRLASRVSTA